MHELQIAQNIISIVNEELLKSHRIEKVQDVFLVSGRMRAIIPETLIFSFDVQKEKYPQLLNAKLSVQEVDIVIKCKDCNKEQTIKEPTFRCQKCTSPNITIQSGNELFIDSIELFDEE